MLVVVIDGILVVDVWLLICFNIFVIVEWDGCCECGSVGGGGCVVYDWLC